MLPSSLPDTCTPAVGKVAEAPPITWAAPSNDQISARARVGRSPAPRRSPVPARQRLVNLLVSNLPGPATPLFLAGTPVLEIFQFGVVQGNVTVSVGALSYAGQLNLDLVGDPDAAPDLTAFADGISGALRQLDALDTARPGPNTLAST